MRGWGAVVKLCLLPMLLASSIASATFSPYRLIAEQIEQLQTSYPTIHRGHIGFRFVDADTGEVFAEENAEQFFTPASNTKLYTTAVALERLGSDYRFITTIEAESTWSKGQPVVGSIRLVGGGDPNLSGRVLPFSESAEPGDPLLAIHQLADQIADQGIRRVEGDVIGDDTRYPYAPYPSGWTFDDGLWYYGTPVSALTVNDSSVHLRITPADPGTLAEASLVPDIDYFIVQDQIVTVPGNETHVSVTRRPGSNEVVLTGTIGQSTPAVEDDLGVLDPALFAARALKAALQDRGIAVAGEAIAKHSSTTEVATIGAPTVLAPLPQVASIKSAPLWQAIQVINKTSQNLHAEMLLRELGLVTRQTGTLAAGLNEREAFLNGAGVAGVGSELADGSGLARQNLTSPAATVTLLRYMWARPERDRWLASLPTGAVDGSLRHRFRTDAGGDRVHAKTGSLAHVSTLSGYLQRNNGQWVIFSMMANAEADEDATAIRNYFDRVCEIFLNY